MLRENEDNLLNGYSVQGARVLNNLGETWGEFDSHEIAVATVKAFSEGFRRGREIGKQEGREALQQQFRNLLNVPREFTPAR